MAKISLSLFTVLVAAALAACSPAGTGAPPAPPTVPEGSRAQKGFNGYTMQEYAVLTGVSPGGPKAGDVNKPPQKTKSITWMDDIKSRGSGSTYTGSAYDDLDFGQLSVSAESKSLSGSNDVPTSGESEDEARWTDAVFLHSAAPAGTLESFTLTLVVNNPKTLDGGNGPAHKASLQVGAIVEDISGTTFDVYYNRYLNSSGTDSGHAGVNTLAVRLPVGTSILLTGVVDASAGTTAIGHGNGAYADAEVSGARVCLIPPAGVSLISASGASYGGFHGRC